MVRVLTGLKTYHRSNISDSQDLYLHYNHVATRGFYKCVQVCLSRFHNLTTTVGLMVKLGLSLLSPQVI